VIGRDLNMLNLVLIAGGFAALILGGSLLVQGAVGLAQRLGVSPMIIGLTLVGFGTSMPEMVTSLQAAFAGSPGIAVGNVIGSNIANILLILGAAALLRPMLIQPNAFWRDGPVLLAVTLLCVGMVLYGEITRGFALILLAGLAAYTAGTILSERRKPTEAAGLYEVEAALLPDTPRGSVLRDLLTLLIGMAITIAGARALVAGAISLATAYQVPEALIGVTIVAIGTSLPELVTSVIAARRGQSDVALGNVIGSNIFNILAILGTTAALKPLAVQAQFIALDIWVMTGATLLLLLFARTGWRIGRREGVLLLAGYLGYTGFLVSTLSG
jgi:cation:H+ antiporter